MDYQTQIAFFEGLTSEYFRRLAEARTATDLPENRVKAAQLLELYAANVQILANLRVAMGPVVPTQYDNEQGQRTEYMTTERMTELVKGYPDVRSNLGLGDK